MVVTVLFAAFLLLGLASTVPTSDDYWIFTEDFFSEKFVVATAQYDIVNILLPVNGLIEFPENDNDLNINITLFFTEADKDAEGKRLYKGLYVLKNKKVTKLLDHGTGAASDTDISKTAYFGALDGIYKYNNAENTAEKYGTVNDSIIGITKVNGTDLFYILTEDHVVYKVTKEGTNKERVTEVSNAQQIVVDKEGYLYFYTPSKEIFVLGPRGVTKIRNLPASSSVDLLAPYLVTDGIPVVLDNVCYLIYPNGSRELKGFEFKTKPTAYSMEGTIFQYFAHDKKIYEYNFMKLLLSGESLGINRYLKNREFIIKGVYSALKDRNRVY